MAEDDKDKPKFTMIRGGGGGRRDEHARLARHHLRELIIEILRGVARAGDHKRRIASELSQLIEHAGAMETPISSIVDDVLARAHDRLNPAATAQNFERWAIVTHSLRVAAEGMATDNAARGRMAMRKGDLRDAIDRHVRDREVRRRRRRDIAD